ncbi:LLM class flavin-dependent oxidoreductase [Pseudonocardia petroleophila]|uniref:LLM class flavin-dependent oxidoreductase n=1 Tax=Pseudonocardia petroleophila TaxID=37331 RepID=A0A7G7MSK2_9PSEU|nr:LLM class flavin-dependent oxidoreductase [Pseudonocardia petroleophila]
MPGSAPRAPRWAGRAVGKNGRGAAVAPVVVPLSVLDLVPVGSGSTPTEALQDSTALIRRVEQLGYRRYWVAEHHGMPGIASSSPAVLIAHLAGATSTIRVGSGGVMLPNHQPLVVAEQFGTLDALHPGRIDLGIGRAPGTDPRTAQALRRGAGSLGADDFLEQLTELASYFRGEGPVTAVPAHGQRPDMWLLGSSGYSAQVAGLLGLPFAFAHHFSGENTDAALALYRETFRPGTLQEPYAMICASVLAAETDAQAQRLALPSALQFLRLRLGTPGLVPTPEEAAAYPYSAQERAFVDDRLAGQVIGSPDTVRDGVRALVERTGVDELMVVTGAHAGADRIRSYELLTEAFAPAGTTAR